MTGRTVAEIRVDLANCDRGGVPWPAAARRLLTDVPDLLGRLEAVEALCDAVESGARQAWSPMQIARFVNDVRAALSVAPQPEQIKEADAWNWGGEDLRPEGEEEMKP